MKLLEVLFYIFGMTIILTLGFCCLFAVLFPIEWVANQLGYHMIGYVNPFNFGGITIISLVSFVGSIYFIIKERKTLS